MKSPAYQRTSAKGADG